MHNNQNKLKCNISLIKKMMDVVLSFLFLVFFLPLVLLVSLAIKLESPGPIIFRQKRAGKDAKEFTFYKLRSMYIDGEQRIHKEYIKQSILHSKSFGTAGKHKQKIYKLIYDPRITKIGRLIRKTSIDEIPQFLNVLKGEMSIVGPRPPIPYEIEYYDESAKKRFQVKPGITGLWQVSGRSTTTFKEMIEMDLRYIDRWSIWLDIKIILKTIIVVTQIRNAY